MSYIVKVVPAPAGTNSTNVLYVTTLGGTVVDTNTVQVISTKNLVGCTITNATLNGTLSITANTGINIGGVVAAGGNIATANAISTTYPAFVLVTGANGTNGVRLPTPVAGMRYVVKNSESAAAAVKVYPPVNCTLNEQSANASITQAANTCAEFFAVNSTAWYSNPRIPS
jgi:hypothetical protein